MTLNLPPYPSQSGLTPSSSFAQFTVQNRVPSTTDVNWPVGTIWIYPASSTSYLLASISASSGALSASWLANTGGSGAVATITGDSGGPESPSGGNFNLLGTANQITVTGSAATETFSIPSAFIAPGSIASTTTITSGTSMVATTTLTAGTGITSTTGNIVASAGNISATAGSVSAGTSVSATTTVTAGTGLTVTTGNADVLAGNANVTGNVIASKSSAGANVTVQATNSDNTSGTSNAGVEIATGGASSGDPYLSFQISGVGASTMTMGLDNSASDLFVISNSATIGSSNALTLSQAGALSATTSVTAGTSITATAGDITATLGNVIINGAAKQFQQHGGAATDFIGQATLVNGVATVLNTNIAATDRVFVSRTAKNASTAYGVFQTVITPATNFVITSCKSDTTTETNDQSTVDYIIIRQV